MPLTLALATAAELLMSRTAIVTLAVKAQRAIGFCKVVMRAHLDGPVCGIFDQQHASAPPTVKRMCARVDEDFAGDHGLLIAPRTPYQRSYRQADHKAQQIGSVPVAALHAVAIMGQGQAIRS